MKLEYNILWLDNDLKDYIDNGDVASIEDYLKDFGFEPRIVTVFDEADIDSYLDISYDLIISDFNLNNESGDIVIYRLREEKRLDTEILFYSARTNFINDKTVKDRLAFMERINIHVGRDRLLDKIEKVIELTVRKLFELNATRGLITAATSDLDIEIEKIAMYLVEKQQINQDNLKEVINSKVVLPMEKRLKSFWGNYDSFQNYFHRIDAVKKWEIFRDLLKIDIKQEKIKYFLDANRSYQDEVIEIRNKFAHAKAEKNGDKVIIKAQLGKDDFEFDADACIQIRRNLIKHKKSIEDLKENLNIV